MKSFKEWMKNLSISIGFSQGTSARTETGGESINPIAQELSLKAIMLMEPIKEEEVRNKIDEFHRKEELISGMIAEFDEKENIERLNELGFTSATPQHSREIEALWGELAEIYTSLSFCENRLATAELIVRMKEYWGEESLLVPYNDFEKICHKYGLTCGFFEEYTGYVPSDKIGKIGEINRKITDMPAYWHRAIKTLNRIIEVDLSENLFYANTPSMLKCKERENSVFPFYTETVDGRLRLHVKFGGTGRTFICAPKKYMKGVSVQKSANTDPFICAYTDYGILVLERWDLEADDELIRKYQWEQSHFTRNGGTL